MKVRAFRILKTRRVPEAFSGDGARRYGSRWTSKGTRVVYVSQSLSLAALEVLVHAPVQLDSYSVIPVSFDESVVTAPTLADLPKGWADNPPSPATRAFGDAWAIAGTSVVLAVPSAVVAGEQNYILNPEHPDFDEQVLIGKPEPFEFDPRLRRKRL